MPLPRILFPRQYRAFPGKRAVRIGLRTLHLVGTAGIGGGFLYQAPREAWMPYLVLTVASGATLLLVDVWSNGIWLIQLRGVAILAKIGVLSVVHLHPAWAGEALVTAVVISGLIAHAPSDVRYWSVWHRRRVEEV
ncbi:MAG: hypothetical protein AB1505_19970 [Candidatus Latescibacterota bacterium]